MDNSRRKFLKRAAAITGGAAIAGMTRPVKDLVNAAEQQEQPDYKWEAEDLPCNLIEETTNSSTPKGYKAFSYKNDGRAHITHVDFMIKESDFTVHNIKFHEGCDGSTEGVAKIAEGKDADFIISRVKGLECNLIKSGSSCPDQLANGIEQAVNNMRDLACGHCFFTGSFETARCNDFKQFYKA